MEHSYNSDTRLSLSGVPAPRTDPQAKWRMQNGLNWEGARFNGGYGHPNSVVAGKCMTKNPMGLVSYDKDPLQDRLCRIARFEGISAIVGQMRAHPLNERVARLGCYSLANTSYRNFDNTVKTATARGANAVIKAMQDHPDSEGLNHWAVAALACMSQGSEDGRRVVVLEGGGEAVASAMAAFPTNEAIQGWGVEMLQSIRHHGDGSERPPLEGPGRSFGSVLAQARSSSAANSMGYHTVAAIGL